MYAIGNYDNLKLTGYLQDGYGRLQLFATLAEVEAKAKVMNGQPHAEGRVYAPVATVVEGK